MPARKTTRKNYTLATFRKTHGYSAHTSARLAASAKRHGRDQILARGTKLQVWRGIAARTPGGLTLSELKRVHKGGNQYRIVSKRASEAAKARLRKNPELAAKFSYQRKLAKEDPAAAFHRKAQAAGSWFKRAAPKPRAKSATKPRAKSASVRAKSASTRRSTRTRKVPSFFGF